MANSKIAVLSRFVLRHEVTHSSGAALLDSGSGSEQCNCDQIIFPQDPLGAILGLYNGIPTLTCEAISAQNIRILDDVSSLCSLCPEVGFLFLHTHCPHGYVKSFFLIFSVQKCPTTPTVMSNVSLITTKRHGTSKHSIPHILVDTAEEACATWPRVPAPRSGAVQPPFAPLLGLKDSEITCTVTICGVLRRSGSQRISLAPDPDAVNVEQVSRAYLSDSEVLAPKARRGARKRCRARVYFCQQVGLSMACVDCSLLDVSVSLPRLCPNCTKQQVVCVLVPARHELRYSALWWSPAELLIFRKSYFRYLKEQPTLHVSGTGATQSESERSSASKKL